MGLKRKEHTVHAVHKIIPHVLHTLKKDLLAHRGANPLLRVK